MQRRQAYFSNPVSFSRIRLDHALFVGMELPAVQAKLSGSKQFCLRRWPF
jgi:hypothetical protein